APCSPLRATHADLSAACRAAPDHEHVAAGDVRAQIRMKGVAHGVHDGPDLRRDAVEGQHVGGGHHDELGEGAVAVHSDDAGISANVAVAGAALQAVAAHDVALGGHQLTDLELGDTLAQGDDLPGELVPYHDRGVHAALRPGIPIGDGEAGAAHARMPHRAEFFAGA